jgi:hypothetical protein
VFIGNSFNSNTVTNFNGNTVGNNFMNVTAKSPVGGKNFTTLSTNRMDELYGGDRNGSRYSHTIETVDAGGGKVIVWWFVFCGSSYADEFSNPSIKSFVF